MQTQGYVICEYSKIKQEFPEFKNVMALAETALRVKCDADWAPMTYGGIQPMAGQYGKTTIMPELFNGFGGVALGTRLTTWLSAYTAVGSQRILQGSATGGTIAEDYKIALAGLAFLSKAQKVTEFKMQIGDKKYGRTNIEEMFAYEQPCLVFEDPIIIDEEVGFEIIGYVQSLGQQRLKPIGIQMNRVPNKLQVSLTGSALQ